VLALDAPAHNLVIQRRSPSDHKNVSLEAEPRNLHPPVGTFAACERPRNPTVTGTTGNFMIFLLVATLLAGVAAVTDWRRGLIPNWLTYSALVAAPLAHGLFAFALGARVTQILTAIGVSLLGAALCGLLPFLLWLKGLCGGGDVKLFAALGAVLEPFLGFEAQVYSFYVAAFFVPLGLIYRGTFLRVLKRSIASLIGAFRRKSPDPAANPAEAVWFPLGPAIFAGCLLTTILNWGR